MPMSSYQDWSELLLKDFSLDDPLILCASIIGSILACKLVYDFSHVFSSIYYKSYAAITKMQRIEWNNRQISSAHAYFITFVSFYYIFWSDLYSDQLSGLITMRRSPFSTFALGVSVGYFIADLAMIIWFYPSLGRMEYVIHHLVSMVAVAYAMWTGEGQLYTYMVLISETTTPWINLRWYLDTAGMKRSTEYLINGVVIFFTWLVARIILFMYLFYHLYFHYDKVRQMHTFGQVLVSVVPVVLSVMNLIWFSKIVKGLKKTLTKRHKEV